jgi:hypothetical protein
LLDDENAPLSELLKSLRESLAVLQGQLDSYRLRLDHLPADLSLYGFLLQAWENGGAVLHLVANTAFTTAAFPNTRACFEAGEDALYLITESNYDRAGARARVYERLEQGELRDEMDAAFSEGTSAPTGDGFAKSAETVEADAAHLDREDPGKGQLLREALNYFRPKFEAARRGIGRHPGSWTEKSRRAMARELEKRIGDQGFGARLIATYAHLSRNSHPRLRLENWQRITWEEGRQQFVRTERSARIAVGVAEIGVKLATKAMEQRP